MWHGPQCVQELNFPGSEWGRFHAQPTKAQYMSKLSRQAVANAHQLLTSLLNLSDDAKRTTAAPYEILPSACLLACFRMKSCCETRKREN